MKAEIEIQYKNWKLNLRKLLNFDKNAEKESRK